jgi:hypothetical protein
VKPESAPEVPGKTPWERLDNAVRSVFGVSKDQVLKEEAKQKRKRATKRKTAKSNQPE